MTAPHPRIENLAVANEVRIARSQLKRDINAGKVTAAEVLLAPTPDWLRRMKVEQIVLSTFNFRRRICQRIFLRSRVTQHATVGGLTTSQREHLITELCEQDELFERNRIKKRARPHINSVPSVGRAS